ncbi:Putative disease resistance RPP13-like protein 1 [Glycine soja]|nr:Putative disease resistance RPP13-like protein 1 [Glycine soja]
MAEGFLQHIHEDKAMESSGEDCFKELLSRSLIQKDIAIAEEKFRMHDLVYDLARLVSGRSSCYFEGSKIPKTVRHLSFSREMFDVSKKFEDFYELMCLRTFLPRLGYPLEEFYLTKMVSHDLLPKLRCLRILSLSKYKNITELPVSIDSLLHLRYLDLSYTSIESLPTETFMLYNLQTLILSNCEFLIQLPQQIGNLVNLRHLDLSGTNLPEMPAQICRLQDLRTLTVFIVGRQDGLSVRDLRNFPYLQGRLSILNLHNVVNPVDASRANLKNKEKIEELMLEWGSELQNQQIEKDVLDNLQPSTNLKKLDIKYYGGTSFPNWIGDSSFSNIIVLRISDCNNCLTLPSFGQLPSLKELVIKRMKMVKTVGYEFYSSNGGSQLLQPFPSLESLEFEDMLEWQEWLPFEGEGSYFPFPCLKRLHLYTCPKLRGILPNHLPSLTEVSFSECNQLVTKSSNLHWNTSIEAIHITEGQEDLLSMLDNFSYCELFIEKCDSLQSLPRMILSANCLQKLTLTNIPSLISFPADCLPTSLQSLDIWHCRKLEFLSHDTWHRFTSLEKLRIWNSCRSLTSFSLACFPALQELYIRFIPNLEAITTQGGGAAPKLVDFIVTDCDKLRSLPDQIDLPSLEHLDLSGLPKLASLSPRCFPSSLRSLFVDVGILSSMSKQEIGLVFQCLTSLTHLLFKGLSDEDLINTLLKEQLLPISLKILVLHSFGGLKWLEGKGLQNLTSLQQLYMYNCPSFESSPEDQLPSSLELVIKRMKMVKTVGYEFYSSNGGSQLLQPFPSLESLEFEDMLEWQEWLPFEGEGSYFPFPCLKRLHLYTCPKLRGILPNHLPSLTEVSFSECNQLVTKSSNLHWNTSIEAIHITEGQEDLLSMLDNFSYCELFIEKCDSLQSLPRMILSANCLQKLTLTNIPSLISFPADCLPTSLQSLDIWHCRKLEFLSHDTWHRFTSLEKLRIWNSCRSLTSFSLACFPALQELYIRFIPNLEAITTQGGGAAPKLVDFIVTDCDKLRSLPDQIDLPSLEHLDLSGLPKLASLSPRCFPSSLRSLFVDVGILSSMSKQEIGLVFQCLTSLTHLLFKGLSDEDLINTLLKEQLLPISLKILFLHSFDGLKLLEGKGLQNLTSLQQLYMYNCPSFESLPEDHLPPSLAVLSMRECPLLEARYRSQNGKYWSKIAHIPAIKINEKVII